MHSELDVPAHVQELLVRFLNEDNANIEVREILRGGYSGAFVALVNVSPPFDGVFVFKVGALPHGYANEIELHKSALAQGAFSSALPPIVAQKTSDSHYALVLRVAGGSRLTWRPLVDSPRLFASAYSHLSEVLWDPPHFSIDLTEDRAIVQLCLNYQLDEAMGGRIHKHAVELFGPSILSSASFVYRSHVLPNPLYFLSEQSGIRPRRTGLILGPVHGDCHPGNVFFEAREDAIVSNLCLIDLAAYREKAPFFFDHAYFELATLLRALPDLGEERWYTLCCELAKLQPECGRIEQHERAWCRDIAEGRETAVALYNDYPDRRDDFTTQFLLVQVAAGLAFLNKLPRKGLGSGGLTPAQYRQAFIWGATFLESYLYLTDQKQIWADLTSDVGGLPVVATHAHVARRALSEEDWIELGEFDPNGSNVLILDRGVRNTLGVAELLHVPWIMVIDLDEEEVPGSLLQRWETGYFASTGPESQCRM